ncbi:MAG: nuclear transport factor 2 family protein [Chloroflexi bacterium]|nr:nuclear transport factor 2 family protein [Chloroflexota bacterium]
MNAQEKQMMETVLKRLEAVENELAILRTMYQYAHGADYGPQEKYLDAFAEDGAFEHRSRIGHSRGRHEGRQALAAFDSRRSKPPHGWTKHLLLNPMIAVSGEEAHAESFWVYLADGEAGPVLRSYGRYRDRLVKGRDGKWRIKERIAEAESRVGSKG